MEYRVLSEPEYPYIKRLNWDDWNTEHVTKHGITLQEIEEVISGAPTFRETYQGRLLAVGPTRSGKLVTVVIGPDPVEPDVYYAFSARPISKQDLRWYLRSEGGEEYDETH